MEEFPEPMNLNFPDEIPIIDISPYYYSPPTSISPASPNTASVIHQVHEAAATWGLFVITHSHPDYLSISLQTQYAFVASIKKFFSLSQRTKLRYDVRDGGLAWRGYMPPGGEHTHGKLDHKEGLYVGTEHPDDHPLMGQPLHGKNRLPDDSVVPGMRENVLRYLDEAAELGRTLTDIFSLGLRLEKNHLRRAFIEPEPVLLLRCFKYPPVVEQMTTRKRAREAAPPVKEEEFGIGEHTGRLGKKRKEKMLLLDN